MPSSVVPHLSVLTGEQIDYVHQKSLEILKRSGVRVDSAEARRVLQASHGVRWLSEERACLEPELIEWAIQAAPATVSLFDRNGDPAFRLGEGRTRFGIGVTNLYYQDPLQLPAIGRALSRAYLPDLSVRQSARLLRTLVR